MGRPILTVYTVGAMVTRSPESPYLVQQRLSGPNFIIRDDVPHPRIYAFCHDRFHTMKDFGTLIHTPLRNVGVDITAAEKHRRAAE